MQFLAEILMDLITFPVSLNVDVSSVISQYYDVRNYYINAASKSPVWSGDEEIVMRNIETTIFPLIFVLCMCGFYVFEYPHGRPRLRLTILYILTSWLLYIYLVVQTKVSIEKYDVNIPLIIYISIVVASIFVVLNIYYYKVQYIWRDFVDRKKMWVPLTAILWQRSRNKKYSVDCILTV